MADDLSHWLSTAAVIETKFSWLKQLTTRAGAEFMFRAMAIWASDSKIDSVAALLQRRAELEAQPFWQDALSVTRKRLSGVLDELASPSPEPSQRMEAAAPSAPAEACPNGVCQQRMRDTLNVDKVHPDPQQRRDDQTASGKTETAVFGLG